MKTEKTMYRETLLWILDEVPPRPGVWDDEMNRRRIGFVHSLGLTCDSVGWCRLELGAPGAGDILDRIEAFCRTDGWRARGWYTVEHQDPDPAWFELVTANPKDQTCARFEPVPCEGGGEVTVPVIHAWRESAVSPKERGWPWVPARLRNACMARGEGVDFCWIKDIGKYAAEQYFAIYPTHRLAHIGVDWKLRTKEDVADALTRACYPGDDRAEIAVHWCYRPEDRATVESMDGWLPRLASFFHELNIRLPACYPAAELPTGGITLAHHDRNIRPGWLPTCQTVLIHRDLAHALIAERALAASWLRPALVVDTLPPGYLCVEATPPPRPTDAFIAERQRGYETLLQTERPVRRVTEKEALSALRRSKRERKGDFRKPFPKASLPAIEGTPYAPLAPYSAITDGGLLSDEYELLPYARAVEETAVFFEELAREELVTDPPVGVVIGRCPDGDRILLAATGAVLRFSHEEPVAIDSWSTLPQFIYEALTES